VDIDEEDDELLDVELDVAVRVDIDDFVADDVAVALDDFVLVPVAVRVGTVAFQEMATRPEAPFLLPHPPNPLT
jgi:hypothetical protein